MTSMRSSSGRGMVVKRVGRQDEKHIRQVDRDLHEVIPEVAVLIEHLQQRR